jgi:hypothetical protein
VPQTIGGPHRNDFLALLVRLSDAAATPRLQERMMRSIRIVATVAVMAVAAPSIAQTAETQSVPQVSATADTDQAPKPRTVRIAGRTVAIASLTAPAAPRPPVDLASLNVAPREH